MIGSSVLRRPLSRGAHPRRPLRRAARARTTWPGSATRTPSSARSKSFCSAATAPRARAGAGYLFLFTDIVGSTEKAAELGDKRWRDLLARHDETAASQNIHRGREVKTMGDGFLATFDGPARAIGCAPRSRRTGRDRNRDQGRHPHRRGRAGRRRRQRHGGQHRRPDRRPRRLRRAARLQHRPRAGGRLRPRVRGPRSAHAEGRPRRVAPFRGRLASAEVGSPAPRVPPHGRDRGARRCTSDPGPALRLSRSLPRPAGD